MGLLKTLKVWKKGVTISVESVMAYKLSFFILCISLFFGDLVIPVVSVVIYSVSAGIPGWSLYEFVLFQGTLILVIGIWHALFAGFLGETIDAVVEGSFDKILLKPFSALVFLTSNNFDPDGVAELLAGAAIVGFSLIKLNIFSPMLLLYLIIVMLGAIFEYSLTIIAASCAFIFVKTWRLFELISIVERFSRYPMDIYGKGMQFMLTFVLPAAVASYYPASVLLGKQPIIMVLYSAIAVAIFFALSLVLWHFAIKKYNSAGG